MKLIWMSDIHLNFLQKSDREVFYQKVKGCGDVIVISGDIAESHNFTQMITEMQEATKLPVSFVLGNHDFYGSSVKKVKAEAKKLDYLSHAPVELTRDTIMIGVDGWGDCRNGDFENSRLVMNDWWYIDDLRKAHGKGMDELKIKLQQLADKDARALKSKLKEALSWSPKKVIIVTHVPPFEEACMYAGRKSTPSGLPFFSSQILGSTILPIAKKNPGVDFLWLSGHTHSRAKYKPCNNMSVRVAKSEYFNPQVEAIIDV